MRVCAGTRTHTHLHARPALREISGEVLGGTPCGGKAEQTGQSWPPQTRAQEAQQEEGRLGSQRSQLSPFDFVLHKPKISELA